MTFGDDWGWGTSESSARELFDAYLEAGGNFIDTADLLPSLASGLLSSKYRPDGAGSSGRLAPVGDSGNPAVDKFSERNWAIVAGLERVANEMGRSMAQVAVNWVANRPNVASVMLGVTKRHHLQDWLSSACLELRRGCWSGVGIAQPTKIQDVLYADNLAGWRRNK
ncbi:MAG: aldo/keto reductase [Cyanobacteria bacterium P01_F01_bin.42]